MTQRKTLIAIVASLMFASIATADILPRKGAFTSYFFTDRWGQGVFDIFFVKSELTKKLSGKSWRPLTLTSNDIQQLMNPGAGMIRQVENVTRVDNPPLRISLTLDDNSIPFGGETKLHIIITNTSDKPIELYRRNFCLRTTVHKRGVHPDHEVQRDEIYDCFKSSYGFSFGSGAKQILRATMSDALFTNAGSIQMHRGVPFVLVEKDGKPKRAGLYDEDRPMIAANGSREFVYSIGSGWLVNEYELQIHYRPREKMSVPYILSPPMSFDVDAKKSS